MGMGAFCPSSRPEIYTKRQNSEVIIPAELDKDEDDSWEHQELREIGSPADGRGARGESECA